MDLSTLAGNPALKAHLSAVGRDGLAHAYIISGPEGSGRRTLALRLAQAMLCSGAGAVPCGQCAHCRKVTAGVHPDLIRVGADGADIRVDAVRAMRTDAYIRPNEGDRKVYLVEGADTMNESAQNALLKLLEEGPAYAAFLLVCRQAGALLPTVRSRCVELSLSPLTYEETLGELRRRFPDRSEEALSAAAGRCEGVLGRALEELSGAEPGAGRQLALQYAGAIVRRDELGLMEFAVTLEKAAREDVESFWSEGSLLFRDALVGAGERDGDRRAAAQALAHGVGKKTLLELRELLEQLRGACAFHVGSGHLAGWLSAESWRLLSGGGQDPVI